MKERLAKHEIWYGDHTKKRKDTKKVDNHGVVVLDKRPLIKVKLKDLENLPHLKGDVDIYNATAFKHITKSIEKKGYLPEVYGYPEVVYQESSKTYKVLEGNHRFKILKVLYGEDYEIEVREHPSQSQYLIDSFFRVIKEKFSFGGLVKFIYQILKQGLITLYTTPILIIYFFTYIVFWQFYNFLITFLLIILINIMPRFYWRTPLDKKLTEILKPEKKLHILIFNIIKNAQIISYIILTLWLTYRILVHDWLSFLILLITTYVTQKILEYFTDDAYSTLKMVVSKIKDWRHNRNKD